MTKSKPYDDHMGTSAPFRGQSGPHGPYWPDAEKGPYGIYAIWAEVDGRLECVGLALSSVQLQVVQTPSGEVVPMVDEAAPVAAGQLRQIRWGAIMEGFRERFAQTVISLGLGIEELEALEESLRQDGIDPATATSKQGLALMTDEQRARATGFQPTNLEKKPRSPERRGGRPSLFTQHEWEEKAAVYRDAVRRGVPPNKALAKEYNVTVEKARNWTAAMRRRGFELPAPSQGSKSKRKEG